ncbi:hypothetical protein JCM5296_002974 [Sporobolomyces johnsonii]
MPDSLCNVAKPATTTIVAPSPPQGLLPSELEYDRKQRKLKAALAKREACEAHMQSADDGMGSARTRMQKQLTRLWDNLWYLPDSEARVRVLEDVKRALEQVVPPFDLRHEEQAQQQALQRIGESLKDLRLDGVHSEMQAVFERVHEWHEAFFSNYRKWTAEEEGMKAAEEEIKAAEEEVQAAQEKVEDLRKQWRSSDHDQMHNLGKRMEGGSWSVRKEQIYGGRGARRVWY